MSSAESRPKLTRLILVRINGKKLVSQSRERFSILSDSSAHRSLICEQQRRIKTAIHAAIDRSDWYSFAHLNQRR